MNEFVEWVRQNAGMILLGIIGLLILSIFVGFLIGTVSRKAQLREAVLEDQKKEEYMGKRSSEEIGGKMILPQPVVVDLHEESLDYLFFFDQKGAEGKGSQMIPVEISQLLKSREIGLKNDVKAFEFHNQKHDVLTNVEELAEP